MLTCETCQKHLLPFLYDLLDGEELRQVATHLETCSACKEALIYLQDQQKTVKATLKEAFAEVSFRAPKETGKAEAAATVVLPRRAAAPASSHWTRVVMAASVLVAVVGAGLFLYAGYQDKQRAFAQAQIDQTEAEKSLNAYKVQLATKRLQNQKDIQEIQAEIEKLKIDWNQQQQKTQVEMQKQNVHFIIRKPQSITPGGLNAIQIDMRSSNGKLPKKIQVAVMEDKDKKKKIFEQTFEGKASIDFVLPRSADTDVNNGLTLEITTQDENGLPITVRDHLKETPEYMTHVATDRPMYRPGDTVRFRSLTLDRFSLKPAREELQVLYKIQDPSGSDVFQQVASLKLKDAQNKLVNGPDGKPITGVANGEFTISPDMPGGPYTLVISEANKRFPEEKRRFLVNNYQPPRFNKEFDFHRKSYGPGEQVVVNASVTRVEGGALINQKVLASARMDGATVAKQLTTDAAGKVQFRFDLPASGNLPKGEGSVTLVFYDGQTPEAIDRPIPIVLNRLFVDFYPEGGDLIHGLPARVYFQAKTNIGKPADLKGRIIDTDGKEVAAVETLTDDKEPGINQGMGVFAFTPEKGKTYELKIDAPKNIEGTYPLPTAKADGTTLLIADPVKNGDLNVAVRSPKGRNLLIGAYCRGKLLDHIEVTIGADKETVATLRPPLGVGGVYRVTVFDRISGPDGITFVPLSERLVYNPSAKRLDVAFKPDQSEYNPGAPVKLHMDVTNETSKKTPVVGLVSVVDLSVLKLADDKTLRALPTHFLLTSEIQKPDDLENVDVLLGKHPKALSALDLLLGTQGWRRFAEQDPAKFQAQRPDEAPRLLMAQAAPKLAVDSAIAPIENARREVTERFVAKQKDFAEHKTEAVLLAMSPEVNPRHLQALQVAHQEARNASDSIWQYENFLIYLGLIALMIVGLALGLALVWWGAARMHLGQSGAPMVVPGAMVALLCVGLTLMGVWKLRSEPGQVPGMVALAKAEVKTPDVLVELEMAQPPADKFDDRAENKEHRMKDAAGKMVEKGAFGGDGRGYGGPGRGGMPIPKMMPPMAVPAPAKVAGAGDRDIMLGGGGMGGAMNRPGGKFGDANMDKFRLNKAQADGKNFANGFAKKKEMNDVLRERQNADMQFRRQLQARAAEPMPNGFPGVPMAGMAAKGELAWNMHALDEQLRAQGKFDELAANYFGLALPPVADPSVLRQYAHQPIKKTGEKEGDPRSDFTETVFWHPALVFADGSIDVSFTLSQSTTRFQVLVLAHSLDGHIGSKTFEFASKLPFSLQPLVPFEVTATDKIIVPIELKNDTAKTGVVELTATLDGLRQIDAQPKVEVALKGKTDQVETRRGFVTVMVDKDLVEGQGRLTIGARSDMGSDGVTKTVKIAPNGFPVDRSQSGLLEQFAMHDVALPESWVKGTLKFNVGVFPSTLADLQKGLEAMLREPGGCFEQTSSTNYPNIMILSYLKEADIAQPDVESRAKAMVERGYQRLIGFECNDPKDATKKGYEWFGGNAPAHEALTAYGLLQFKDMANIVKVDDAMLKRTEKYLLSQRDGKGGFKRNARALDTFGRAPQHITDAYIVWSLGEAKVEEKLDTELKALREKAKDSKDPYFIGLVALAHLYNDAKPEALELLKDLKKMQKKEGNLVGADMSITGSRGRDLDVETTAIAILGWLKANRPDEFQVNLQNGVEWINKQRGGGGFGATQSTILALKALIAFTKENKKAVEAGEVRVTIDDQPQIVKEFPKGANEPISIDVPAGQFKPGKNKVQVEITGGNVLPYTLSWSYQTLLPVNPDKAPVTLKTSLAKVKAAEQETMKLNVVVKNESGQNQGMAMAIIGLPAGMAIPARQDQLKDLMKLRDNDTKPGKISYYEIRGRELVLYWRALAANETVELNLDVNCAIPGEYTGPASRAYLYYQPDLKYWTEPLKVAIEPNR